MYNKDFLEKEYTIKPTLRWFEKPIEVVYSDDPLYITLKPYVTDITSKRIKNIVEIMEESDVKIDKIKTSCPDECVLVCMNKKDLELEKILTTLSAMKNQLGFEMLHHPIAEIQCKMTPLVKNNLLTAGKKLRMYGKPMPIIPSFDDYGRRLPDQIEVTDGKGAEIIIVDPDEYGELYFEIRAIEKISKEFESDWWKEFSDDICEL